MARLDHQRGSGAESEFHIRTHPEITTQMRLDSAADMAAKIELRRMTGSAELDHIQTEIRDTHQVFHRNVHSHVSSEVSP